MPDRFYKNQSRGITEARNGERDHTPTQEHGGDLLRHDGDRRRETDAARSASSSARRGSGRAGAGRPRVGALGLLVGHRPGLRVGLLAWPAVPAGTPAGGRGVREGNGAGGRTACRSEPGRPAGRGLGPDRLVGPGSWPAGRARAASACHR